MCGRFYVDDEMLNEIHKICKKIDGNYHNRGDVKPSDKALIIKAESTKNELFANTGIWGYKGKDGKQLLINARAESIQEKPTFRNDFANHRCVIPVSAFYEWNKEREQFKCEPTENIKILYLAGIYTRNEEERFTIITTATSQTMKEIHDRMPVIIPEVEIKGWLSDINQALKILREERTLFAVEKVKSESEFQQMSLF